MTDDPLSKPLGLDPPPPRNIRLMLLYGALGLVVCGLSVGTYGYQIGWFTPPKVTQAIVAPSAPPPPTSADVNVLSGMTDAGKKTLSTAPDVSRDEQNDMGHDGSSISARDMERESGVKINRPTGVEASGVFIPVPSTSTPEVPSVSVSLPLGPDQRLLERSRFGLLPRVGADGTRPLQVYARAVVSSGTLRAQAPRIALMVGGMGLNKQLTYSAIDRLPAPVTLAFAPYGDELENLGQRARARGHEVMLQMPMEPFDAADVPGPHTLMSGESAQQNIDHAQWLMSRLTAYVGVANFLGAKMLSQPAALAPVMREIAQRGLMFVDDGSSQQSLALRVAGDVGLPAVRADVLLDGTKPEVVEASIARLEAMARDKGLAFGVATGSALMIERLSSFARSLEGRGLLLVPVSSLANTNNLSSPAHLAR